MMIEPLRVETTARRSDVTIKTTAEIVVSLERNVAAPRLPKSVWLEPPKAAPISAPLLLCIRTMNIKKRQTMVWIIKRNIVILPPLKFHYSLEAF